MSVAGAMVADENFGFPFEPYEVQRQFMKELFAVLRDGKVGLFESPTGTGKSLSMICGALTWLRYALEHGIGDTREPNDNLDDEPDWIVDHFRESSKASAARIAQRVQLAAERRRKRISERKSKIAQFGADGVESHAGSSKTRDVDPYLLDDYFSDDETGKIGSKRLSRQSDLRAEHLANLEPGSSDEDEDLRKQMPRIIFCSRTHSQLLQFANELKLVVGADTNRQTGDSREHGDGLSNFTLAVVPFGSRRHTCINPDVRRIQSVAGMNDRCLDLLKARNAKKVVPSRSGSNGSSTTRNSGGCVYLAEDAIKRVRDEILTNVHDIEEVVSDARKSQACPYFVTRSAIQRTGQFLILPYNVVLHKPTRDSIGIDLNENCVVIFDEAHNVMDAIIDIHSAKLSYENMVTVLEATMRYCDKYARRLRSKNLYYIRQLMTLLRHLIAFSGPEEGRLAMSAEAVSELQFKAKIDNINVFKLLRFIGETKFAQKVQGFTDSSERTEGHLKAGRSDIYSVVAFLNCLTNSIGDGRVVCSRSQEEKERFFKYLMLNPSVVMNPVMDSVRAVVFAGGTLSPRTDIETRLLSGVAAERKTFFSCGHVVPEQNVLGTVVARGPSGLEFDFRFQNRNNNSLIDELGRAITNMCSVIPKGVIVFFPSYAYLNQVSERWKSSGLIKKISRKKQFLVEQPAIDQESVLAKHAQAAAESGALLLSVVGGKLSEGINFSNDLGRAVIMVGLPYPNPSDVETREILSYIEADVGSEVAREYLEDICMKAVNQSVGRCIRHRKDFASIIFMDKRYTGERIRSKLASWIRDVVQIREFGESMHRNGEFFRKMPSDC